MFSLIFHLSSPIFFFRFGLRGFLERNKLLIRCEVDSNTEVTDYRVMGIGCDVSSELSVQQAFRRVMDSYGRIDSVVASAGTVFLFPSSICTQELTVNSNFVKASWRTTLHSSESQFIL